MKVYMKREEVIEVLKHLKPELEEKYGVKKIGLFGSYAQGQYGKDSDLDLVVELDKPDLLTLIGIKQTVEEKLRIRVDIVRYRERMNRTLKKRIDKDAVYV